MGPVVAWCGVARGDGQVRFHVVWCGVMTCGVVWCVCSTVKCGAVACGHGGCCVVGWDE